MYVFVGKMSGIGFHSLYMPDPTTLRVKPRRPTITKFKEEEPFEREKEIIESQDASKRVGRLLGGSAASSSKRGKSRAKKTVTKRKRRAGGANLYTQTLKKLATLYGVNKVKKAKKGGKRGPKKTKNKKKSKKKTKRR